MDLLWYPLLAGALLLPAAWLWRRHAPVEAVALGAAIGVAGWAAGALGRFFLVLAPGPPRTAGLLALAGAALGSGTLVWWTRADQPDRPTRRGPSPRTLLLAIAGVAAMTLGIEATVPHYGIAMLFWDWWEHFDLANFYRAPSGFWRSYGDGSTITSRTPLFNLLASLALSAVGDRFTIFQVVAAAVGWLWALPAALLARRVLGSPGSGLIAALALSPMILFCTAYTWPKGLVLFCALLALERFLGLTAAPADAAPRRGLEFGLAGGLTVMAHAGFVGYLLPLYVLLGRDALRRRRWRAGLLAVLMAALVALPWYAWAVAQYGWRAGLLGYPQPASPSIGLWIVDHVVILASSLLPASLGMYRGIGLLPDLFIMYLGSAVGLLGAGFLLRTLARLLGRRPATARPDRGPARAIVAYAAGGVLIATVLINGWGNGWAAAQAVFLPALITLTMVALARWPATRAMVLIAVLECLVVTAAALIYMWSAGGVREPNAVLAAQMRVRFLGQDTWPLGIAILVAAAAGLVRIASRLARPSPSAAPVPAIDDAA
ncbi:MAG TPA: hypothetical protein VET65_01605 [Candidatus Limnocylindrales bacterium]|nr:hypothetical protein [Candidatus Limnocylindrales bacterium]